MLTAAMILKDTPWKESYDPSRQHIKKPRHYFVNKVPPSQAMVFPVVMNGCESWTIKTMGTEELMPLKRSAGEDSLESFGQQRD